MNPAVSASTITILSDARSPRPKVVATLKTLDFGLRKFGNLCTLLAWVSSVFCGSYSHFKSSSQMTAQRYPRTVACHSPACSASLAIFYTPLQALTHYPTPRFPQATPRQQPVVSDDKDGTFVMPQRKS
ncbi:hypothetical protein KC345_g259 [Hortaea werneckii]|nr:hypothetical protein KC345_g259 [Hortaea werneckii]